MKRLLVLGIGCWVLGSIAFSLELGGSYENDVLGLAKRNGGVGIGDLNRFRLKLDQALGECLALHLEPRYYFLAKSQDIVLTGASDLDQLVLDRAYLKYRTGAWSLTAGKQRIAWGSGYIWNPVDIFNPFVLAFAVKDEDKTNVEALRVEVPVGAAGGIDGFVLTGKPWEMTGRGIRLKGNVGLFDLALSYVDQGALGHQFGFDTAGDIIKDVGMRGEIALKNSYTQAVIGGDYTLNNGVGLNVEYYFNGLGSRDRNAYNWGNVDQVGMDYLFCSANKIIDEITTVTGSVLMNLDDRSFMLYPSYSRSLSDNLDLELAAMISAGEIGTEFYPSDIQDPTGFIGSKMVLVRTRCSF
jgi:hypothetical protein